MPDKVNPFFRPFVMRNGRSVRIVVVPIITLVFATDHCFLFIALRKRIPAINKRMIPKVFVKRVAPIAIPANISHFLSFFVKALKMRNRLLKKRR